MATIAGAEGRGVPGARAGARISRERLFFSGLAIAAALTVFAGFAPTYYLKGYFNGSALSGLLHVHGLLFSTWIVLFVTQTLLVAARRTDIHRRLGVAGAILAAAMIVVGYLTAVDAVRRGSSIPGVHPHSFLIVPIADVVFFAGFIVAALYYRRRPDTHKRLMVLATAGLLTAAIARLNIHLIGAPNPLVFFGVTDLFLVALAAYDLLTRRRLHPATLWGGLVLILSQPLRVIASGSEPWMALAGWMVG